MYSPLICQPVSTMAFAPPAVTPGTSMPEWCAPARQWCEGRSRADGRASDPLWPAASHIRRGSKTSAASMVRMTTPQKATAPTPGSMVTMARRTAPAHQHGFHEDVDHRPPADGIDRRIELVRSRRRSAQPDLRRDQQHRHARAPSAAARRRWRRTPARPADTARHPSAPRTPPRMVLGWPAPSCITVSTG